MINNSDIKINIFPCGQGDCFVLEWETEDNKKKVGVIDCNKKNKNPDRVFSYISTKYDEIEFILLTHPHDDHYSGFDRFFDLLSKNIKPILVKKFIASYQHLLPFYDRSIEKLTEGVHKTSLRYRKSLALFITKMFDLKKTGIIEKRQIFNDSSSVQFSKKWKLACLSPSTYELDRFMYLEDNKSQNEKSREHPNNPDVNYLSISLGLFYENVCFAFFTSDITRDSLDRLKNELDRKNIKFNPDVLIIQIPHHGSGRNHNADFWGRINLKDAVSFLSVGKNNYKHPSISVIEYFNNESSQVLSTVSNIVEKTSSIFKDEFILQMASDFTMKNYEDSDGILNQISVNDKGEYKLKRDIKLL